tara:strand:- start:4863 stop:5564 length:702 start_codon:yes stop_codon:yes gene_type:complete
MTKTELLSFIGKYSLGGNVESVAWGLENNSITTNFVSSDKTLKGTVTMNNADINTSLSEVGIFTTSQLIRMLSILDDDITVSVNDTSIQVNDKYTNFSFVLADLDVIPKSPKLKMTPSFTSTIKITDDFINKFVKSHGALPDNDVFTIEGDAISKQIIFGYSNTNSNRISFNIDIDGEDIQPIHFSAGLMREVLVANKNTHGTLEISPVGLGRVKFNTAANSAEYYLVSKQID